MDAGELVVQSLDRARLAGALAVTQEGFASYGSFAPPGWTPPADLAERMAKAIDAPGSTAAVAIGCSGEVVGVMGWMAARVNREGPPIAGLAHVFAIFVVRAWWGRGLAARLLALAVQGMRAAGYGEARLYTPAGQARARAFYRREGWAETAAPRFEPSIGLEMVELRRAL